MNILERVRSLLFGTPEDMHLCMDKGGNNDLRKWEAVGGTLKRPAPPIKFA